MGELQIAGIEQIDISSWDFDRIKIELEKALSVYKNTIYTDEKSAKEDKSDLNKVKTAIENRRKEYKAQCMAPYNDVEPKIKELVAMIENQRIEIDGVVKEYTAKQKAAKENNVKAMYAKKAEVLGDLAEPLYEKIRDEKWLNKSTTKAKYETEMVLAISEAKKDIDEIHALNSPFVDTLIEKYVETFSLEEVVKKNDELLLAANKAGMDNKSEEVKQPIKEPIVVDEKEGTIVKIYANEKKLNQVFDFMESIGVTYEVQ